jgi:hypothetical protein
MSDRNTPIWPFPGQPQRPWWECCPPHNLPPPRFAVGDRVETRWGAATVLRVYDHEHFDGRAYQLRYDWAQDAPPGFGHRWGESDMRPLVEAHGSADDEAATAMDGSGDEADVAAAGRQVVDLHRVQAAVRKRAGLVAGVHGRRSEVESLDIGSEVPWHGHSPSPAAAAIEQMELF